MPVTLRTLSLPLKVLATCFLLTMGIGYLFAVAYLYLTAVQPHANGTLVQAIALKCHGDRGSSRLAAMQRAEKNIDELLEDLNRTFHRLRQSGIDEELFDVVSGFEALSRKEGLPSS